MKSSIFTLAKVSLKYWMQHKRSLLTLFITIVLGTAALCCAALLIRSEKMAVLEEELVICGDYDVIVYDVEASYQDKIQDLSSVECLGFYYELGYAGGNKSQQDTGNNRQQRDEKADRMQGQYKVAAYGDEASAQMYHMTCIEGEYPTETDEVALDIFVVKALGIPPLVGERVTLPLYDLTGQLVEEREFRISGIFQATSEGSYGGWIRYSGVEGYVMPAVMVSPALFPLFDSGKATFFLQVQGEPVEIVDDLVELGIAGSKANVGLGRSYAYTHVLGITDAIWARHSSVNLENVLEEMKAGRVIKDFYSGVLIPIFSFLILLIVWFSVYGLIKNVVRDKAQMLGILRSIGLNAVHSGIYLAADMFVMVLLFALIGLGIGCGLYIGLMWLLNTVLELQLTIAFEANEYVRAVTNNPFVYPIVVILLGTFAAVLLAEKPLVSAQPIQVLQGNFRKEKRLHKKRNKYSGVLIKGGWRTLLNCRVVFRDMIVMGMVVMVMSVAFFGYTYFRAMADKNNSELRYRLAESGVGEYDYLAYKSAQANASYNFGIYNRHECGISQEAFEELEEKSYVESAYGLIVNDSTRLTFMEKEWTEAHETLLAERNLRGAYNTADAFEASLGAAEDAMIRGCGYAEEEMIYRITTVGVSWEYMQKLEEGLIAGRLQQEKIASGEEVILVVRSELAACAEELFPVGTKLPLSDIVLSNEEDTYDFSRLNPAQVKEPVFLQEVLTPEGMRVELTSYAFGYRKDITTKVGAILVLDGEHDHLLPEDDLQILCLADSTFAAWGLPDELLTKVAVSLKDGVDLKEADADWFALINSAEGISYVSTSEIKEGMQTETNKVMAVYYLLVIMLLLVGMVAIAIGMYTKIRLQSNEIAYMRAVGMKISQLAYLIICQNISYLGIGILCAPIPAGVMQVLFNYIKKQIDTGVWEGTNFVVIGEEQSLPWWRALPFRYDLFSYEPVQTIVWLCILMGGLVFLLTVFQLIYIRKQQIVKGMEEIGF